MELSELVLNANFDFNNSSAGQPFLALDYPEIAVLGLLILLLGCVFGSIGNVLVILAVAMWKPLHTVGNVFVVNLAIADLLIKIFSDPFGIVGIINGRNYFLDRPALCTFVASLCLICCFCSLLSIGFIAVNRYVFICRYSAYPKLYNRRTVGPMLVALWLASCIMELPNYLGRGRHIFDPKNLACLWDRMADRGYTFFVSVVAIGSPCVLIAICYLAIFLHVRSRSKRVAHSVKGEQAVQQSRSSIRLARTLFLVFAILVVCWTPYAFLVLFDHDDRLPVHVHAYAIILAHFNSTVNPIVYGVSNPEFRRGYRHVCRRCCLLPVAAVATKLRRQIGVVEWAARMTSAREAESTLANMQDETELEQRVE